MDDFANTYEDVAYAEAYARLEFPGTYYLAFRDLPKIFFAHIDGSDALDFGCGTGRSTRFLRDLGFKAIGVDIAEEMVAHARRFDPGGDYRVVADGDLAGIDDDSIDLAFSAFTFDNIPTREQKTRALAELSRVIRPAGTIVNLVSSPEIYTHEWASFSTKDFPENRHAKCGDEVRIVVTELTDRRPTVDVLWPDDAYREVYKETGLEVIRVYKPLGKDNEPIEWVNETRIPPWVIYILSKD